MSNTETMAKIDLGSFTADVYFRADGKYDAYIGHEGISPDRHEAKTANEIGEIIADYIECIAEGYANEFGGLEDGNK